MEVLYWFSLPCQIVGEYLEGRARIKEVYKPSLIVGYELMPDFGCI